jgi:predicted phage baseplate assembly protein
MALPIPNLDDKTFKELVDETGKLIPVFAPQWTNHNLSDPGITLMELLAWLTEMQLYSLNVVSDRHLLKYLNLLGITPRPASPARVDVQLSAAEFIVVPEGTVFKTVSAPAGIVFESDGDIEVIPVKVEKVVSYASYQWIDVTDFNEQPYNYFHAFGQSPKKGDALYLGLRTGKSAEELAGKTMKLAVYTYEDDLPPVGSGLPGDNNGESAGSPAAHSPAEVVWQYWSKDSQWNSLAITSTGKNTPVLSQKGFLTVGFPEAGDMVKETPSQVPQSLKNDELMWIRCYLRQAGYEIPPRIDRVLTNLVPAAQGQTRQKVFISSGLPHQEIKIQEYPIIPGSQTVKVDGGQWEAVRDFDASGPGNRHYVIMPGNGEIRFGDGIKGAVPAKNKEINIRYRRVGEAVKHIDIEIEAGALTGIDIPGLTVTNPYPSYGSRAEESIDEAFIRFKQDLYTPGTAVTADDYEYIARATPGLRVARARAVVTPGKNEVTVAVVPYSFSEKPVPAPGFKKSVCGFLDLHRPITTYIRVCDPDYVKVSVSAEIKLAAGYGPDLVRERVREALNRFLAPLSKTGGSDGWPFGRPVYRSEINEVLEDVEGVDCVTALLLSAAEGSFVKRNGNIEIGSLSLVYPGTHEIRPIDPHMKCEIRGNKKATENTENTEKKYYKNSVPSVSSVAKK